MTATDELRRLLDERGVEWWPMHDVENGYREDRDTEFLVYGCKHVAHEWGCRLQVDMLTPEQAVEATLGRGECRDTGNYISAFECDTCGGVYEMYREPSFCPSCGRRVMA